MSTEHSHCSGLRGQFSSAFAALIFLGASESIEAQNHSSAGTWDCVISGARSGVAYLTFSSDTNQIRSGTFEGYAIMVPKVVRSPRASLIPGMVEGLGSNGLGPRQRDNPSGTNLFGFFPIRGHWARDSKERVNGSFAEHSRENCVTETNFRQSCVDTNIPYAVTNSDGSVSYSASTNFHLCFTNATLATNVTWSATSSEDGTTNFYNTNLTFPNTNFTLMTNCSGITNTTSFVGKAIAGKRLTLAGNTPQGRFVLRGVPAPSTPLRELSGSWMGIKKQNRIPSFEVFALSPLTNALTILTNDPNAYSVDGAGPDYAYTNGLAILSSQKKIGFAFEVTTGTNYRSNRAVVGTFNLKKLKANMTGLEGTADSTDQITVQVQKLTAGP